jgi:hypothetical protein
VAFAGGYVPHLSHRNRDRLRSADRWTTMASFLQAAYHDETIEADVLAGEGRS